MKDAPLKTCTCGQNGKVKRLPGRGAGIIFKGSGFYETDYRRRSVKSESARTESGKEGAPREGGAPAPAPGSPPSSPPSTTPSKE